MPPEASDADRGCSEFLSFSHNLNPSGLFGNTLHSYLTMAEITKTNDLRPATRNLYVWIFAILIVVVYFFGLTIPLVGPDEPRYAQVAREMWQAGDWVTPTLGGFHWFEKPALLYWLQISSYNIFGVSEFAARFGSALFGLGTIASLWLLGRSVESRDGVIRFSNLLALIAASSIGIIVFARGASFDIILTFPITASLVSYWLWERKGSDCGSLVGFYFFIGVALLAKGLVGIVFPFAIVTFYHLLSWKWPKTSLLLSLFWGTGDLCGRRVGVVSADVSDQRMEVHRRVLHPASFSAIHVE